MSEIKTKTAGLTALGLMSGTSMDGIDIALIKSDGYNINHRGQFGYYPYDESIRYLLSKLIDNQVNSLLEIKQIELEITKKHIEAVNDFLKQNQLKNEDIDVIGFHGQTILHKPNQQITWQIGNAQLLASSTGIDVVADFRNHDIVWGGQGAPLVPIYHQSIFKDQSKTLLVLNIGGVANLTYISQKDLIAFDVCFGNAPGDDLIKAKTGKHFDNNGELARVGKVNQELAREFLAEDYFYKLYPKSLDRNQFQQILAKFNHLKLEDALATLSFIIGQTIADSFKFFPNKPEKIIVCGGGRKNLSVMDDIANSTKIETIDINELGINGDAIEAEAFGFLAIRSLMNLPISYPKTTGILLEKHESHFSPSKRPSSCGGVFYRA